MEQTDLPDRFLEDLVSQMRPIKSPLYFRIYNDIYICDIINISDYINIKMPSRVTEIRVDLPHHIHNFYHVFISLFDLGNSGFVLFQTDFSPAEAEVSWTVPEMGQIIDLVRLSQSLEELEQRHLALSPKAFQDHRGGWVLGTDGGDLTRRKTDVRCGKDVGKAEHDL